MQQISGKSVDIYIRQSQLIKDKLVPFSAATLWRRVQDGTFPAPIKISQRVTAWRLEDILHWQSSFNKLAQK
ncbi:AlpA family phage regulatory protein [Comamonas sp. Y33R10-2]|nr:AlpA family phage regulatory protein [Comamonas sp. Y33R10-2]